MEEEESSQSPPPSSIFPLLSDSQTTVPHSPSPPRYTSFTTDLSLINTAVSAHQPTPPPEDSDEDGVSDVDASNQQRIGPNSYELLSEEEEHEERSFDREIKRKSKRRSKKKSEKRRRSDHEDFGSRKSSVRAWSDSSSAKPFKDDYYFDTHGDRDNLVYGSLYKYFFFNTIALSVACFGYFKWQCDRRTSLLLH